MNSKYHRTVEMFYMQVEILQYIISAEKTLRGLFNA